MSVTLPSRRADVWLIAGLCVWLAGVTYAMAALWKYKETPGKAACAPLHWPLDSRLARKSGVPTLVLFAHPKCSCTRASLAELRRVVSSYHGHLTTYVLFMAPDGVGDNWIKGSSWRTAQSIPGVLAVADPRNRECHRFGALTSGQVVLYDSAGRLTFSGGITGARGHEGDNDGREQVTALARHQKVIRAGSPVFGCPLDNPQ